jgi:nitrite reductase/ring-hydroxylating ferredoxin subunit
MKQNTSRAIRVAATKDIVEGAPFCAKAGDKAFALFKTPAGYVAIDNLCPHAGGPLCEGAVKDGTITCPWHGSKFNIETGAIVNGPATMPVATYPVEVRGEDIFVQL